jgi:putative tricarboxylic transport membrane protein
MDSLRVGIGWATTAPRRATFPFFIGLLLLGPAAGRCCARCSAGAARPRSSPQWSELRDVGAMLLPTTVFIVAVPFARAVLPGRAADRLLHEAPRQLWLAGDGAVALGVPLTFFLIFERWFLVPLPKGPIEAWLGFCRHG